MGSPAAAAQRTDSSDPVPNALVSVEKYQELLDAASAAGVGTDLVVQTAYGDSGKTTFFIDDETGWKRHQQDLIGTEIKVMKRINNRPVAVEAVLTRSGTIVGPFMSELTGHSKLTPYRGGWCGNEMFPEVLTEDLRREAGDLVARLGDRLGAEGYRGFFEVDVLVDTDTDEVYLGELNPRISGASSITNVTAGAYADIPLFCLHLLEFFDVPFEIDVDEINTRWRELAAVDQWSQMVIKETSSVVQADLGVLVTKGRLQRRAESEADTLTIRAKHLIDSIRDQYAGQPSAGAEASTAHVATAPSMAK